MEDFRENTLRDVYGSRVFRQNPRRCAVMTRCGREPRAVFHIVKKSDTATVALTVLTRTCSTVLLSLAISSSNLAKSSAVTARGPNPHDPPTLPLVPNPRLLPTFLPSPAPRGPDDRTSPRRKKLGFTLPLSAFRPKTTASLSSSAESCSLEFPP